MYIVFLKNMACRENALESEDMVSTLLEKIAENLNFNEYLLIGWSESHISLNNKIYDFH